MIRNRNWICLLDMNISVSPLKIVVPLIFDWHHFSFILHKQSSLINHCIYIRSNLFSIVKLKNKCIQIDFARELQFSTIFTKNILETKCNQKIYIIFAQDLIHLSIYVVILACGWLLFDLIISKQKLISNYIEFTYFTTHLVIKNEIQYPLSANFQH